MRRRVGGGGVVVGQGQGQGPRGEDILGGIVGWVEF